MTQIELAPEIVLTARSITGILAVRYKDRARHLFVPEMRVGTAYGKDSQQQIDVWTMNLWPSDNFIRQSFEIKISKSDYKKELDNPLKRRAALRLSNNYWFVAPEGIIDPATLPLEAGLMEIDTKGRLFKTVDAPWRDTPMPTWRFFAAFARRVVEMYPTDVKGD